MDPRGLVGRARDSAGLRGPLLRPALARVRRDSPSPPRRRCARLAFDSLLQRDGADAARGRAFARFETRFQIVWVVGGLVAVLFSGGGRAGIFLVALVLLFGGLSYVGGGAPPGPEKYRRPNRRRPARRGSCPSRSAPSPPTRWTICCSSTTARFGQAPGPADQPRAWAARRARPHPVRVRRRRARRCEPRVFVRAHDARRRGGPRGRGLVGRRGADAPPAGRAQPDDRGAPRRRARAR